MSRLIRVLLSTAVVATLLVAETASIAGASTGDKKLTKCAPKTATKAIAKALKKSQKAKTGADTAKLMNLEPDQVDAFAAAMQQSMDARSANSLPEKLINIKVTCRDKTTADFTYDVSVQGTVVASALPWDAVLKKGKWLLDPVKVCDNLARSTQAAQLSAATACYTALGIQNATVCPINDPTCTPRGP